MIAHGVHSPPAPMHLSAYEDTTGALFIGSAIALNVRYPNGSIIHIDGYR